MLNDKVKLLRPYQREDAFFIAKHYACGVFNEQRTGKTPTTLIGFRSKGCKKVLIICPKSMLISWKNEFEKWYEAPCLICTGTPEKRKKIIQEWTDGMVINYETAKDIVEKDPSFDAIILDEAHRIKGRTTPLAATVLKLKNKCKHKAALTGTPAPNYQHEIWAILNFLFPKYFRSYWKFVEDYFETETCMNYKSGKEYTTIGKFKSKAKEREFQELLNKIAINRKREEVMPWLPKNEYLDISLPASKLQRECLDYLQEYFEIPNTDIVCKGVLDRLTRYRQICVAPALINIKPTEAVKHSPKLAWLQQYIKDYPNTPTLIFTNYTSVIKYITPMFPDHKCGVISGSTSLKERQAIKEDFQDGCIDYIIANITTCKEGLTLDRAETVIFLDQYPPIAAIEQAEDRFIATDKSKIKVNNRIIRLTIADTYEEHLKQLISEHKSETDIINDFRHFKA